MRTPPAEPPRDLPRRAVLRAAAASALGAGLATAIANGRAAAAGRSALAGANPKPARACILLYMAGGPSQIDTFDPKPGRATGGPFRAIATRTDGVLISEHLPGLAARMDRIALVRSLVGREGNHDRARHLMHTGYAPAGGADHPAFGALVAEARPVTGLPGYVAIGGPGEDAGFLPAALSPFLVRNPTKPVRNLAPAPGLDAARFEDRIRLVRALDAGFAARGAGDYARRRDDVTAQAVALMRAPGARAFDLSQEPAATRGAYGEGEFGAGCLMARRLVEAGVPFVEVSLDGWDTHEDNFARVERLSRLLDQAASALLDDLAARGLLDSTLVVWMGDFGRTPKINEKGGRDHHPAAASVLLAGGGVKGGQVIGATDADGRQVVERPCSVPDLFRSVAFALDLDPDKARVAPSGRPLKTVDGGAPIPGLFRAPS